MSNNIKHIFGLFFTISFLCSVYSNAQTIKKDSVYHTPFDTNKISNPYILDYKSDTIGINDFIWSDRRNLSEILNDKAGYFINYLGIGGRNPINFNNFNDKQIGIFRDGVQINDNFFGGFDEENISVSEIQKIEEVSNISSFLYGMNSSGKALNIITRDAFQPTLFSQLRYSQDRYGALFSDFSLNVPFSKKFNFIFGVNSHFY
ncbi:MAG: TonB-dependent receptor plug domain-containing protein, partial [Ignavibacteriae bacterium]|nr:TonB-dependent receptor plug domain-containing protein [Ignavibacteriota bacterium]